MTPLTRDEIKQELDKVRAEVTLMREEEREAWALVLAFLEQQQQQLSRERATFDRTIAGIKAKLAE